METNSGRCIAPRGVPHTIDNQLLGRQPKWKFYIGRPA